MRGLALLGMAGIFCAIGTLAGLGQANAELLSDSSRVRLGVTTVNVGWGDDADVSVSLTVRNATPCELARSDYWGTAGGTPRTVVTRMLVTMGGDTVFVPFGAYGDLSEPLTVAVACSIGDFTITVVGGDAAGSYSATFVVSGLILKKRRVASLESPDDVWEETTYSWFGPGAE